MANNQALMKQVQKFLRPEEECQCAGEAKFIKRTGKKRARVIAIVGNIARKREVAVFALKSKRFQQTVIKAIYPITQDFSCRAVADTTFEISYASTSMTYSFESVSPESMTLMLQTMNNALRDACEAGTGYQWISCYTVTNEDRENAGYESGDDEGYAGDAYGAGAGSSSNIGGPADNPLIDGARERNEYEYNPDLIMNMKELWIAQQMKEREAEFTTSRPLELFVGTWNVNGKDPAEKLEKWLLSERKPVLYAIGFQELDLTAGTFLLNNSNRSGVWEEKIEATLQMQGNYVHVLSRQLVGILLCVYVEQSHKQFLSEIQSDMAGVGVMGMMGNKGGVAIRFKLLDSSICIVNSHLAARMDHVERRNQDWGEICRRLAFQRDTGGTMDIFDHDFVFWIGDLNYRITLPDAEVKSRIAESDWEYLLQYDQLRVQMAAGNTFTDFTEGEIDFAPTYKYDPGTNRYDTSEKKRTPAWCDRVLWLTGSPVQQISYSRHELMSSDHKPVSSVLEAMVKEVIVEQQSQVYHSIVRDLDKMDNECLPDATVSTNSFAFGPVRYLTPVTRTLVIENVGQVVIKYSFIPKPNEPSMAYCKPWLWIHPAAGMIIPGESCTISITAKVDSESAPALNTGQDSLDDVIILHLENGKDFFITISGQYMRSCFGASLSVLTNLTGPARTSSLSPKVETRIKTALCIPKELWRQIDYLYEHGMDEEDLFLESGDPKETAYIRECLDTGTDLRSFEGKVHSVAETLFCFLESLAEPVIPYRMLPRCNECAHSAEQCQQLINVLPTVNYNVFVYVTAFLRELLAHSDQNNLSTEKLAVVFSRVLLREPRTPHSRDRPVPPTSGVSADTITFLSHFLKPPTA